MECVSEPDLRSAEEAVGYLEALKRTFVQLGISDVKMEEGSLRCDANVSLRPVGSTELGTKTEIKNMNSFRSVRLAIEKEIERQRGILESGGRVIQETRGWDESAGDTHSQRSKEEAHDYRYFPDPDLSPLEFSPGWIDGIKKSLPATPYSKYAHYVDDLKMPSRRAAQLVDAPYLSDLFDIVTTRHDNPPQPISFMNFLLGDVAQKMNELGLSGPPEGVSSLWSVPASGAAFVNLLDNGTITSKAAKDLFPRVWSGEVLTVDVIEAEGLGQVSNRDEIKRFVDDVIANNADTVAEIRKGKDRALQFLLGQVMKASRGKANPAMVSELLREAIGSG
jgi:aspartyl-tRNA(Asn)/glutamyl-tRNA(Gln) amidotransferase subunit B